MILFSVFGGRLLSCNKQYFRSFREHFMVSRFGILFYVRLKVCCTNSLVNIVVTHDLSKRAFDSVGLLYFARSETVLCSTHFYILNLMTGRPTSLLVELCCARMNFKLFLRCVVRFICCFPQYFMHESCITILERRRGGGVNVLLVLMNLFVTRFQQNFQWPTYFICSERV
jgi:hypothetical protein